MSENEDKANQAQKKYYNAFLKAADHAFEEKEIVQFLNGAIAALAGVLSTLPIFTEYSGPCLERAKEKNITPEEAFAEMVLEKFTQDILEARKHRGQASFLALSVLQALNKLGVNQAEHKEIEEKLAKFAGPQLAVLGTEAANPEVETTKGMDIVSEAIRKAKSGEGLQDNDKQDKISDDNSGGSTPTS